MQNKNQYLLPSNSEAADEVIRSLMRGEGDNLERNFMRYRSVVRDVFRDLNLGAIKYTERRLIEVDKQTNSIMVPCNYLHLASASIIDNCNKIVPLIFNKNITDDLVDVSAKKSCGCECGCIDDLCGLIKNYEAIQEDVTETMPDTTTKVFTKITRKTVYPDGSMYIEYTEPIRIYEEGVWTDTIPNTTRELLCNLEVKPCGCLTNSEKNKEKLQSCCNADNIQIDFGCTDSKCCTNESLEYNWTEQGNRITFPSDFAYDKVLLRYYIEQRAKDIIVPLISKRVFMNGLKAYALEFDDNVPMGVKERYMSKYNNGKDRLAIDMHKLSLTEVYKVLTPYRVMV